jgi:adenylyl- and sulfurtransferase ThiI
MQSKDEYQENEKAVLLLPGGIDSLVAGWMMAKIRN